MASRPERFLFGTETELGVFAEPSGEIRPAAGELAPSIVDQLGGSWRHLPSPQGEPLRRLFLENGACIYADVGGHPELATAECRSPVELAAQSIALREMLVEAAESVSEVYQMPISLVANNVDYALGGSSTYGHHLNVLVTGVDLQEVVVQLTPLMAALPVLAGTGKVSFASQTDGFELSQRASHMTTVLSRHTTESRAIFTAKDEPLSTNGVRVHMISLDTPMTHWQQFLIPAIVALVAKAIELGERPAARLALIDPVGSLQAVSSDPSLSVELPLASGGGITALALLEAYRVCAESVLDQDQRPDWVSTALALWQEMVGNLREDPFAEADRIFWLQKLLMFTRLLEKMGASWEELSRWTWVLASLRRLKATHPNLQPSQIDSAQTAQQALDRSSWGVLDHYFSKNDLSWKEVPRIWSTANRLCALCVSQHVLRRGGELVLARAFPFVTDEQVDRARTVAPQGTRAEVRGRAIQAAAAGASAGWGFVSDGGRRLEMKDAFGEGASWVDQEPSKKDKEPS